jgi:hypothetical protein
MTAPHDLSDAYSTLTDPARHGCDPDVILTYWLFLKEARDQPVRIETMGPPAHVFRRQNALIAACAAALPATRAAVRRRLGGEPKGAA